ncbi:AEC family transporter [Brevibacterium casei]|nr:AEC family transporter [Brevibacterium casei]
MSLSPILLALVPVVVLIAGGRAPRAVPMFGAAEFWSGAERLAYYCLLPVLLFASVAEVDVSHVPLLPLTAALVIPTVLVSLALVVLRSVVAQDLPSFTSVLQGGIRFNTYIGLSISASLFGSEGAALAAIVAPSSCPRSTSSRASGSLCRGPVRGRLSGCARRRDEPLVLGCAAGGVWNLVGVPVPDLASAVLDPLAAAALPIGPLCVGAGARRFSRATTQERSSPRPRPSSSSFRASASPPSSSPMCPRSPRRWG